MSSTPKVSFYHPSVSVSDTEKQQTLKNYQRLTELVPKRSEDAKKFLLSLNKEVQKLPPPQALKSRLYIGSIGYNETIRQKVIGMEQYGQRGIGSEILSVANDSKSSAVIILSAPLSEAYVNYFIRLAPHKDSKSKERLTLIALTPGEEELAEQLLHSASALEKVKKELAKSGQSVEHYNFMTTPSHYALSSKLNTVYREPHPDFLNYGTKYGSHEVFAAVNVLRPDSSYPEKIFESKQLATQVVELLKRNKTAKKLYVKLNDGLSGDGNAVLKIPKDFNPFSKDAVADIEKFLGTMRFSGVVKADARKKEAQWKEFQDLMATSGAIVEVGIFGAKGESLPSPSGQVFIDSKGNVEFLSHHDQRLVGDGIYKGVQYPATEGFQAGIQESMLKIGKYLAKQGVRGHLGVDFLAVPDEKTIKIYALEINLRQTGTTFPYKMLRELIKNPSYTQSKQLKGSDGTPKFYINDDNIKKPYFKHVDAEEILHVLSPTPLFGKRKQKAFDDAWDAKALEYFRKALAWDSKTETGVVPQLLIEVLPKAGKMGATAYANSLEAAQEKLEILEDLLTLLAAHRLHEKQTKIGQDDLYLESGERVDIEKILKSHNLL